MKYLCLRVLVMSGVVGCVPAFGIGSIACTDGVGMLLLKLVA